MTGEWNLGSAAAEINRLVDNIPATLSGALIYPLINRQLNIISRETGATIGSDSISLQYQEPLVMLSLSKIAMSIDLFGTDANSITLGEFTINKGSNSSAQTASKYYKNEAMELINSIKGRYRYYKALG